MKPLVKFTRNLDKGGWDVRITRQLSDNSIGYAGTHAQISDTLYCDTEAKAKLLESVYVARGYESTWDAKGTKAGQ